jgi:hypothetical protein
MKTLCYATLLFPSLTPESGLCLGRLRSTIVKDNLSTRLHTVGRDLGVLVPSVVGTVELHGGDIALLLDTGSLL